jgi:hypothetical protein
VAHLADVLCWSELFDPATARVGGFGLEVLAAHLANIVKRALRPHCAQPPPHHIAVTRCDILVPPLIEVHQGEEPRINLRKVGRKLVLVAGELHAAASTQHSALSKEHSARSTQQGALSKEHSGSRTSSETSMFQNQIISHGFKRQIRRPQCLCLDASRPRKKGTTSVPLHLHLHLPHLHLHLPHLPLSQSSGDCRFIYLFACHGLPLQSRKPIDPHLCCGAICSEGRREFNFRDSFALCDSVWQNRRQRVWRSWQQHGPGYASSAPGTSYGARGLSDQGKKMERSLGPGPKDGEKGCMLQILPGGVLGGACGRSSNRRERGEPTGASHLSSGIGDSLANDGPVGRLFLLPGREGCRRKTTWQVRLGCPRGSGMFSFTSRPPLPLPDCAQHPRGARENASGGCTQTNLQQRSRQSAFQSPSCWLAQLCRRPRPMPSPPSWEQARTKRSSCRARARQCGHPACSSTPVASPAQMHPIQWRGK